MIEWYRKAAEQGVADAQFNLDVKYDTGLGVPQDYTQAAYWYHKAADQGVSLAQSSLGHMYHRGKGLTKDDVVSLMWFYISYANNEDSLFRQNVSSFIREITLSQQQIVEAQQRAKAWLVAHPKKN